MAKSIGSRIKSIAVLILISVMSFAFAIWGVEDMFRAQAGNAVLSLGSTDVTTQEFNQEFQRELATRAISDGRQMPNEEAYQRGVHREVLQRLLTQSVIELDANDLGIGVNRRSAIELVSDIEAFQDELTGEFSENKLMEVLAYQRPPITRRQFEENLIKDLRLQQTIPAINGGVVAPLEFAQQRYRFLTEQRKARVLTLTEQSVPPAPEPTDEQIQEYIDDNEIRFTAPEYRRITMVRIEAFDLKPDVEATEEEIKAEFDFQLELGQLGSPEKRSVVQITAKDEANAKEIAERLNNGENADDIVALLNLIEPVTYDDVIKDAILDPETAEAAFSIGNGEAKAILGSIGNWYAVGVTGLTPAVEPDLESMREELTADILQEKAEARLYDLTEIIEDTMLDGSSIEEAAERAEIPYSTIDYIDRSGQTQDNLRMSGFSELTGIATDETILTEIFTNDLGFETDIFETSTGGWAAIRVDDIIDSQRRPFEEVREQAAALWKTEQLNASMDELMLELAGEAQTGKTLEDISADISNGASIDEVILLRSAPSQAVGPQLAVGLLEADIGDVERGPGPAALTRQIAVLTDIVENTDGLAGQFADILQEQMTAAIRSDLNDAYQRAVISENPLREFPDKIKETLGVDDQG